MQKDSQTVRQQHLISANIFRVVLIGLRIRKQAACRELEKKRKKGESMCSYGCQLVFTCRRITMGTAIVQKSSL